MTCCAGVRLCDRSAPTHCSLMRAIRPLTTLKLTSASSRARRISRRTSSTSGSPRRPRPRRRLKIPSKRSDRESNMGASGYRGAASTDHEPEGALGGSGGVTDVVEAAGTTLLGTSAGSVVAGPGSGKRFSAGTGLGRNSSATASTGTVPPSSRSKSRTGTSRARPSLSGPSSGAKARPTRTPVIVRTCGGRVWHPSQEGAPPASGCGPIPKGDRFSRSRPAAAVTSGYSSPRTGCVNQPLAASTAPFGPTDTLPAYPNVGSPPTCGSTVTCHCEKPSSTRTRAPSRSTPVFARRARAVASACSRVGRPAGRSGAGTGSGAGHATAGQTAFCGHGGKGQTARVDAVVVADEDTIAEPVASADPADRTTPPPLNPHSLPATGVSGAADAPAAVA